MSSFRGSYHWSNEVAEIFFPLPPLTWSRSLTLDDNVCGLLEALCGQRSASDNEVMEEVRMWLKSQPKTFFTHGMRRLTSHYTTCVENRGDCVEKWYTLHFSQIVVHKIINTCLLYFLTLPHTDLDRGALLKTFFRWQLTNHYTDMSLQRIVGILHFMFLSTYFFH